MHQLIKYIKKIIDNLIGLHRVREFRATFLRLINGNYKRIYSNYKHKKIYLDGRHIWCGYYDLQIFNEERGLLIATMSDLDYTNYKLALINIKDQSIKMEIPNIYASKQMGCRAFWLDSDRFVYNGQFNGEPCSVLYDLQKKSARRFGTHFYDGNNDLYVSLDFKKLETNRPGYGFFAPQKNVFEGDLVLRKWSYYDSLDKNALNLNYDDIPGYGVEGFYLNHLKISPSGRWLLVFALNSKSQPHTSIAVIFDLHSGNSEVLTKIDCRASHYCWSPDDDLWLTYFKNSEVAYAKFSFTGDIWEEKQCIWMTEDGHPSCYGSNELLTDTYSDKHGYQTVYILNSTKKIQHIAKVRSKFPKTSDTRCDLHPRLLVKDLICIDSDLGKKSRCILLFEVDPK